MEKRTQIKLWLGGFFLFVLLFLALLQGCTNSLIVVATAYNSVVEQTNSDPTMSASGVRLTPGMKAIAVSRDLRKEGLEFGTKVRIEGLSGEYEVLDVMNKRFTKRIDIYMGKDIKKAKEWGKKTVEITW